MYFIRLLLLTPQSALTDAGTSDALEDGIYPLLQCKLLSEYLQLYTTVLLLL